MSDDGRERHMNTGQSRLTPRELEAHLKNARHDRTQGHEDAEDKLSDLMVLAWPTEEGQDS